MIEENYPKDDVAKFREQLLQDGWEEDGLLPQGWRVRRLSDKKVEFLTNQGSRKVGFKIASEELRLGDYSQEAVEDMAMFREIETVRRLVSLYNWEADPGTLPQGWRVRVSVGKRGKRFYLSPEGVQFSNRRAGLQHMLKEGQGWQEVTAMRGMLRHEGWQQSKHLPGNWFYKQLIGTQNYRAPCYILSEEGAMFDSFQGCVDYMMAHGQKYPESTVAALQTFMAEQAKSLRLQAAGTDIPQKTLDFSKTEKELNESKDSTAAKGQTQIFNKQIDKETSNWMEDPSLPLGWRYKTLNGKSEAKQYLAPGGEKFPNLLGCWQFMLEGDFKFKDMEKMKKSLNKEGWTENKFLPSGWLLNLEKMGNKGFILSNSGELISSFQAVVQTLTSSSEYDKNDVENIKKLMAEANKAKLVKLDWKVEPELPTGWKYRIGDGVKNQLFFLAPNGEQLPSRKSAYIYMIREMNDEEDVLKMRNLLITHEGWHENPNLPKGWVFKETKANAESGNPRQIVNYNFIANDGQFLDSSTKAIAHIRSTSNGEKYLVAMNVFLDERTRIRRTQLEGWQGDTSLPKGWRRKVSGGKTFFMSPEGAQLQGSKMAYIHAAKGNYSQEDVLKMKSQLLLNNEWETSDLLPEGWLFRDSKNHRDLTTMEFISSEAALLTNCKRATDFLKSSCVYDPGYVAKIGELLAQRQRAGRREQTVGWREDPGLPQGWKMWTVNKQTQHFLSPTGEKLLSRVRALQYMVEQGRPETELEKMRAGFISEGWKTHKNLPLGWMYRHKSDVNILTEDGVLFKSLKTALAHLMVASGKLLVYKFRKFMNMSTKSGSLK